MIDMGRIFVRLTAVSDVMCRVANRANRIQLYFRCFCCCACTKCAAVSSSQFRALNEHLRPMRRRISGLMILVPDRAQGRGCTCVALSMHVLLCCISLRIVIIGKALLNKISRSLFRHYDNEPPLRRACLFWRCHPSIVTSQRVTTIQLEYSAQASQRRSKRLDGQTQGHVNFKWTWQSYSTTSMNAEARLPKFKISVR